MKMIKSMSFDNYMMNDLKYHQNNNFDKSLLDNNNNKLNGTVEFNSDVYLSYKNPKNCLITVKTVIGSLDDVKSPFEIILVISGSFTINFVEDYNKNDENIKTSLEESKNLLGTNGNAILYPYIRSIIWDISSKSNVFPPFRLPTVNFVDLLKSNDCISFKNLDNAE